MYDLTPVLSCHVIHCTFTNSRWSSAWPPFKFQNNSDVLGIYVTALMWLVPDDPKQPNDLTKARYLCSVGATARDDFKIIKNQLSSCHIPYVCSAVDSDVPRHK